MDYEINPPAPLSNSLEKKIPYFTDRVGLLVLKFRINNSQMFDLCLTYFDRCLINVFVYGLLRV